MRLVLIALMATFFGTAVADTEHVIFTMRTTWGSPVVVSEPVTSKEFGFESVTLHNYSTQDIRALNLKVVLVTADSLEQEVDSARIHVSLAAGTSKKIDVYLAQVKALERKAHAMRLDPAVTVMTVESVDFADGALWEERDQTKAPIDFPVDDFPINDQIRKK